MEDNRHAGGPERPAEEFLGGHRLPPALSRLPPGRHGLPPDFVRESQRQRILSAALEVFGDHGFAAASIQELVAEAHVSRATFYRFFADKESCLVGLCEEGFGWLREEGEAAAVGTDDWARRVCLVTRRVVALLADDRRLARVCAVESLVGGARSAALRAEMVGGIAAGLRVGRVECRWGESLPPLLEAVLAGGAISVVTRLLLGEGEARAQALDRELAQILLTPYLGAGDAEVAVRKALGD